MNLYDRIIDVMSMTEEELDYERIAVELSEHGHIGVFGVMPRKLICSVVEDAIAKKGDQCPIVRTEPGVYIARKFAKPEHIQVSRANYSPTGIITCYGQDWLRELRLWDTTLDLIGCQFRQSPRIDFTNQVGIYALSWKSPERGQHLVYTGVTGDRPLGECLQTHTQDRLASQWNRFSFYGMRPIHEDGTVGALSAQCTMDDVIASLSSILVEVASPIKNRRSFDYFSTLEFMQSRYWEILAVNNFVASRIFSTN
jgi:hypothetical protein